MKIKNNLIVEVLFLAFIFTLLLWTGLGVLWDHKIEHDRPYGIFAGDGYEKILMTDYLINTSDFKHHSPALAGGFENVIRYQPPAVTTLAALFGKTAGFNASDSTYLLVVLFACFSCLIFYFGIRTFNKKLAILSLPFCIMLFTGVFSSAFTWGLWFYVYGALFLVSFFYSLCHLDKKFFFLVSSFFLGASFMGHISEAIFGVGFIFFYLAIDFILKKKISKSKLIKFALILIFFLLLISHYFAIARYTHFKYQGSPLNSGIRVIPDSVLGKPGGGYPLVRPSSFAFLLIPLIIGIIISFLIILNNKKTSSRILYLIALYILIIGYGNYYGLAARAQQTRFFWPVYFSVFLGTPFIYLIYFVKKKIRMPITYGLSIIFAIVLFSVFFNGQSTPGLINDYHLAAFNWMRDNTHYNTTFLYIYSDILGQRRTPWFSMRPIHHIYQRDLISSVEKRELKENYMIDAVAEGTVRLPYVKEDGSIGHYWDEYAEVFNSSVKSICSYSYYIFDKASRYPELAEYSMEIAKELIKHNFTLEYSNELVLILKNPEPGGKCIDERSL